jgi:hypothetical protein
VIDTSCTLTYNGSTRNHCNVTSPAPLPRDRPSQWQVDIINLIPSAWVMLGVIGSLSASADSFNDTTCYAWACLSQVQVRCAGLEKPSFGSWISWQAGDRGIITRIEIDAKSRYRGVPSGYCRLSSTPTLIQMTLQYAAQISKSPNLMQSMPRREQCIR